MIKQHSEVDDPTLRNMNLLVGLRHRVASAEAKDGVPFLRDVTVVVTVDAATTISKRRTVTDAIAVGQASD